MQIKGKVGHRRHKTDGLVKKGTELGKEKGKEEEKGI